MCMDNVVDGAIYDAFLYYLLHNCLRLLATCLPLVVEIKTSIFFF